MRKAAPEAVSLFMVPGTFDDLRQRMSQRMTESSPEMELRLQIARQELNRMGEFDYCVVNRDGRLDQTIRVIDAIIVAEKCRVVPRRVRLI